MAKRKITPDLDDRLSLVTYQMMSGKVDDLTFIQTLESIFDADSKPENVRSYVRGLRKYRRQLMDAAGKQLKIIGRISRKIKMIDNNFKSED